MNIDLFKKNFGKVLTKEFVCQTISHRRLRLEVCPVSDSPYARLRGYSSKNSNYTYMPDVRLILTKICFHWI